MRRAQTFHTGTNGRDRSSSRTSAYSGGGCFGGSSSQLEGLNLMTTTLDACQVVDVEGDSSSDSDDSPPASPKNAMKPVKKFHTEKLTETQRTEEIEMELHNAITTGECNLSKLELSEFPRSHDFDQLAVPALLNLTISENRFTALPSDLFAAMRSLRRLDLSNNRLFDLPRVLFQLPLLEVLLADHNCITELPLGDDTTCFNLKIFGIEWNDITFFPIELVARCPGLQELWLGENEKISSLPSADVLRQFPKPSLLIKLDNRPQLVQQVAQLGWAQQCPWINMAWNKIYPDKVLDFLYLGSLRTAQCLEVYRDLNIGYVLTAGRSLEVRISDGMRHLVLPVDDLPGEDMTPLFDDAFRFIDEAKAHGKGILIHCFAGLSRSVTLTVGYLMKTLYPMSADEALALVRQSRPAAQPNQGFLEGLKRYEHTLRAQHGHA